MVKAKKSLGQNFLIDKKVVTKIIEAGQISSEDNVLEIGPGQGFLTEVLAEKAKQVLAVEKDENLAKFCQQFLIEDNLEIITGDVLEINWKKFLEQKNFSKFKLIANIPYYITGKILRLFLENSFQPEVLVLMVQKEVAERICQKPGKLGILSLAVQYFGKPEIIEIVSKEKFDPIPEVDSAILKIVVKKEGHFGSNKEKKFFRLIKIGFSNPRKTLINNISAGFKIEKKQVEEIVRKNGFKETVRAQELSIKDWEKLIEYFN
jgi:16S rRNA (adenine1518-N6/adenine1519-N6)-dimethyltransferase